MGSNLENRVGIETEKERERDSSNGFFLKVIVEFYHGLKLVPGSRVFDSRYLRLM